MVESRYDGDVAIMLSDLREFGLEGEPARTLAEAAVEMGWVSLETHDLEGKPAEERRAVLLKELWPSRNELLSHGFDIEHLIRAVEGR